MPETYTETRFDLELKVKQCKSLISSLLEEKRARRELRPKMQKLLLDRMDELAAAEQRLAAMDGGKR